MRRPRRVAIPALLLGLVLVACGTEPTLPDRVAEELAIGNNSIATVSEGVSAEIPARDLLEASARAGSLGTELRFVIAGESDDFVDAMSVVNIYGGTALSYRLGDPAVAAASTSVENGQLDRATAAASPALAQGDLGASARAFVDVLEDEGLQAPRASISLWVWILFALALGFVLVQLRNYLQARKRAANRKALFHERKKLLSDWANRLEPEVDVVVAHAGRLDGDGRRALAEAREQVEASTSALASASSNAELDASEIRVARTAIKLRALRQTLGV